MRGFKKDGRMISRRFVGRMTSGFVLTAVLLTSSVWSGAQQTRPAADAAGNVPAQEKITPAQSVATPKPASALGDTRAAAAQVTEFEVNGLKVLIKRREGSQTVAGGLFIRGGARNVSAGDAGIESLMLSVATEASQSYPRERMRSEMSKMGTSIGSGSNNDYSVLTIASTRPNFDRSWEMFTDVALHPSFTDRDVDLVKSRMITGLQSVADDPDAYLQDLVQHAAYAGHPYINDSRGTVETVSKLTAADLRAYHQKLMQTSRMLLVLVGDLDADQLKARLAASFGKVPRGAYKTVSLPGLDFKTPTVEISQRALPTNYIRGLYAAPSLSSPDYYPMQVASAILNNRVLVEVRFKRNLSYAPEAFLDTDEANTGGLYVTAVDANQAVRVMLDEMTRLKQEPIGQSDITETVAEFLTKYYLSQETNAAQAGELAKYELLGGGWRNSFEFLDRLKAVTPEEVQRVSQKYMRNMRFVVLGNPQSVDKKVFSYGE
jgi:predicted Zn-dependent peptidase